MKKNVALIVLSGLVVSSVSFAQGNTGLTVIKNAKTGLQALETGKPANPKTFVKPESGVIVKTEVKSASGANYRVSTTTGNANVRTTDGGKFKVSAPKTTSTTTSSGLATGFSKPSTTLVKPVEAPAAKIEAPATKEPAVTAETLTEEVALAKLKDPTAEQISLVKELVKKNYEVQPGFGLTKASCLDLSETGLKNIGKFLDRVKLAKSKLQAKAIRKEWIKQDLAFNDDTVAGKVDETVEQHCAWGPVGI